MPRDSKSQKLNFEQLGSREIVGNFDGGTITSDGGGLLIREIEKKFGVLSEFAECFVDYRDARYTDFSVAELLGQRIMGIALGYEDLADHDELKSDRLLAVVVGRRDPTGDDRTKEKDRGNPLSGKSTLNRLELTEEGTGGESRYKKIECLHEEAANYFVNLFVRLQARPLDEMVIDLDATNDPLHGNQEGRYFHGYYDEYCYLPLYMFCGDYLLCAKLRSADRDGAHGSLEEAKRVVEIIHRHWPRCRILFRGDSGFCRDDFMDWCETHPSGKLDYVFGLQKNSRLIKELKDDLEAAEKAYPSHQKNVERIREEMRTKGKSRSQIAKRLSQMKNPCRRYKESKYATLDSWSKERRVIGKAEHTQEGTNPRFVVTSLKGKHARAKKLYEKIYCARGDMENRIKEQQLHLFADRTSTHWMRSNQLRLWFSSVAYMVMALLRIHGLKGTEHQRAQCETIRKKLLRIGAQIVVSVRRIYFSLATGYPYQNLFRTVLENIRKSPKKLTPVALRI